MNDGVDMQKAIKEARFDVTTKERYFTTPSSMMFFPLQLQIGLAQGTRTAGATAARAARAAIGGAAERAVE